jgi:type IV pilus assembly protein PilP
MKYFKLILLTFLFALVSCKKDMSDLDRYFSDAKKIPPQQIEPLPEINSPEVFLYEAEDLRDPFSNDLQLLNDQLEELGTVLEGEGPDLNRKKEILENFPLDGLYMVGTYLQDDSYWGLIEDPEGVIVRVSVNDYMGQNYGQIIAINEGQIDVSEWISDGIGGWTKRSASIALREE